MNRSTPVGYLRAFITVLVVLHHAVLAYHPFAPAPGELLPRRASTLAGVPGVGQRQDRSRAVHHRLQRRLLHVVDVPGVGPVRLAQPDAQGRRVVPARSRQAARRAVPPVGPRPRAGSVLPVVPPRRRRHRAWPTSRTSGSSSVGCRRALHGFSGCSWRSMRSLHRCLRSRRGSVNDWARVAAAASGRPIRFLALLIGVSALGYFPLAFAFGPMAVDVSWPVCVSDEPHPSLPGVLHRRYRHWRRRDRSRTSRAWRDGSLADGGCGRTWPRWSTCSLSWLSS